MTERQQQMWEKKKEIYELLTEEQLTVIDDYLENNMKKLKKICDPLIFHKNIPQMFHDDLYEEAIETLIDSLAKFDFSKSSFKTFFTGNIRRTFYDWTRDSHRFKRCNVKKDKNGEIKVIPDISFDEPSEDGIDLCEKVDSGFRVENELSEEIGFSLEESIGDYSPMMQQYLHKLSKVQIKILELIAEGYVQEEIMELLHIDLVLYRNSISAINSYKNTKGIRSLIRRNQKC